jgi:hypothetical protein
MTVLETCCVVEYQSRYGTYSDQCVKKTSHSWEFFLVNYNNMKLLYRNDKSQFYLEI